MKITTAELKQKEYDQAQSSLNRLLAYHQQEVETLTILQARGTPAPVLRLGTHKDAVEFLTLLLPATEPVAEETPAVGATAETTAEIPAPPKK